MAEIEQSGMAGLAWACGCTREKGVEGKKSMTPPSLNSPFLAAPALLWGLNLTQPFAVGVRKERFNVCVSFQHKVHGFLHRGYRESIRPLSVDISCKLFGRLQRLNCPHAKRHSLLLTPRGVRLPNSAWQCSEDTQTQTFHW